MDKKLLQNKIEAHALAAWKNFVKLYPRLAAFSCPKIILCGRLTKTAGYNKSEQNIVKLSLKLMLHTPENYAKMVSIIIPHELAHQVDYNLNGWFSGKKHHNREWQGIMVDYGLAPNVYHDLTLIKGY